jgi:hypothetical protein
VAKETTHGSTTRNIAAMHRTVIEELRTNSVATRVSSREVVVVPAVEVASEELAVRVALEELAVQVAQAVSAEPVVQVAQVAPVELAVQVAQAELAEPVVQGAQVAPVELAVQVAQAELAEPAIVPAVELVLAIVRAEVQVLVIVRAELVIVQVVLETVPVGAPAKIKSVIAAHHRALVRVPKREADMVVVAAATMREPAATEAARAWVAVA